MTNIAVSFPLLGGRVWNIPRAIPVPGFPIYLYGLIIAFGCLLAAIYIRRRSRDFGLTQNNASDITAVAVAAGIVGSRLYYVAFNPPPDFIGVFKIRNGGLAVYGGIILAAIALAVYARRKKLSVAAVFDLASLGVIIGQTAGRWGNFVNREAFGRETNLPWRMGLHYAGGTTLYVHPTFLYESLWNALGFALLHALSKRKSRYNGQIFLAYTAWYGLGRAFIEGLRADSLMLGGFRVSQILAATLCLASCCALVLAGRKNRQTG